MNQFLPEKMYPQQDTYTKEELLLAMQQQRILRAVAVACDERHDLHVHLGCCDGIIRREEAARGIIGGSTRDYAILSRVGQPVCFQVLGFTADGIALLSRRRAQEATLEHIFREKHTGDILPATVDSLASFGAFCDIGCGAIGLLGIQDICVCRLTHPKDCLHAGERLFTVLRALDPVQRRVRLSHRELLGTWEENAARFRAGQTVTGIVRAQTDYGVFIALTPNLCGLADTEEPMQTGQPVCVYIKAIQPQTLKIKLTILHRLERLPPQPLLYTRTNGRLDSWQYGTSEHPKFITIF